MMAEENRADLDSIGAGPLNMNPRSPRMQRCQSFLWSSVNLSPESIIPPPRSGAASVVVQGKLYMFGVSFSCLQLFQEKVTLVENEMEKIAYSCSCFIFSVDRDMVEELDV